MPAKKQGFNTYIAATKATIVNLRSDLDKHKIPNEENVQKIAKLHETAQVIKKKHYSQFHSKNKAIFDVVEKDIQRLHKEAESRQKIADELKRRIVSARDKHISENTLKAIENDLLASITKFFKFSEATYQESVEFNKTFDSLYANSILNSYSDNKTHTTLSDDKLKLKTLLDELFYKQDLSKGTLEITRNNKGQTEFSTKSELDVKDNPNTTSAMLGIMTDKKNAILYSHVLNKASPEAKESFYEAIFLQATHSTEFSTDNSELKIKSGTLSLSLLPNNPNLKTELINYLVKFKDAHPDIVIIIDSLPEQDKAKAKEALGKQAEKLQFQSPSEAAPAPSEVITPPADNISAVASTFSFASEPSAVPSLKESGADSAPAIPTEKSLQAALLLTSSEKSPRKVNSKSIDSKGSQGSVETVDNTLPRSSYVFRPAPTSESESEKGQGLQNPDQVTLSSPASN